MNVEIGTEAAQFPEKEYINGPVLLATAAKLGIRQERGTRDKPSQ